MIQQQYFEYFISEYSTRTRVTRNKRESESVAEGERENASKKTRLSIKDGNKQGLQY